MRSKTDVGDLSYVSCHKSSKKINSLGSCWPAVSQSGDGRGPGRGGGGGGDSRAVCCCPAGQCWAEVSRGQLRDWEHGRVLSQLKVRGST